MKKICIGCGLVELKRATTLFFCKMSDKILNIKPETLQNVSFGAFRRILEAGKRETL